MVQHVSEVDFNEVVLNYEGVVLVDFWATWCGPCKAIAPVLEKLAAEYKGKIVVYKIDTDKELNLALQYKVASIPTLLLFKNGEVAATNIGFIGEEQVMEFIGQ
mgnify:CR=1 FL=1